eukprot:2559501-Pleurochrysis_carterae.AAC.1
MPACTAAIYNLLGISAQHTQSRIHVVSASSHASLGTKCTLKGRLLIALTRSQPYWVALRAVSPSGAGSSNNLSGFNTVALNVCESALNEY